MKAFRLTVLATLLATAACRGGEDADVEPAGDVIAAADAPAPAIPASAAVVEGGPAADTIVVYKSPTCGCCAEWVEHAKENGFAVTVFDVADVTPYKQKLGVPAGRVSCHTATVRGYTLEGHVPADLVRRMIDEKATFRGLAVPGMPIGSPGMEGAIKQQYDVLAFDDAGNITVYATR
jgi:hypothetical protein